MSLKQVTRSFILWEYSFIYQLIRQDEILFLLLRFLSFFDPIRKHRRALTPDQSSKRRAAVQTWTQQWCTCSTGENRYFNTWIYWYVQYLEENKGSYRNAEGNGVSGSGSFRCSHRGCRSDRLLGECNKPGQKIKSISCRIFPPRSTVLPRSTTGRLHGRHHLHLWPGHTPRLHCLANHPVHVKEGVNIRSALRFHLSFVYDDNREKKYW